MAATLRQSWLRTVQNPFATHKPSPEEFQFLSTSSSSNPSHDDFDPDVADDYGSEHTERYPHAFRHFHHHKRGRAFVCCLYPCSLPTLKRACFHHLTLRKLLYALFITPFLIAFGVLLSGVPPSYETIRSYERRLPQHNLVRAQNDGGRYLRFPGHLWGHGLNNVMQETILMSYLSYLTNRSFVFEDYVWSQTPFPYTIYDFALRPARMPFNAFISGPTAGGPMSPSSLNSPSPGAKPHRLAVSAEFYASICPPEQRYTVSTHDAPHDADGAAYIQWWVAKLSSLSVQEQSCVELDSGGKQAFDWNLFGEKRLLTLWEGLSHSPILQDFSWSHLVLSAVIRNWVVVRPASRQALYDSMFSAPRRSPIPATLSRQQAEGAPREEGYAGPGLAGVLAVHIRRGDYERHCHRLAEYRATYMGFNQFPSFRDVLDPETYHRGEGENHNRDESPDPGLGQEGKSQNNKNKNKNKKNSDHPDTQDIESYYLAHCLPSIPQIVARLAQVKRDHPGLTRVYVLSNAWESWLKELKTELTKPPPQAAGSGVKGSSSIKSHGASAGRDAHAGHEPDPWEDVVTSYDLVLDPEQRYVSVAVDMAIAERAEVFVGNGFSSLSSNIVMLRMSKGMDPLTNRFL
ncbi:hypothetical protein APHAL10511_004080 [Amanita phalloides]|nr:hypothetical protein APHAL10511_004080 [Amanita phalloides]